MRKRIVITALLGTMIGLAMGGPDGARGANPPPAASVARVLPVPVTTADPTCGLAWRRVASPNMGPGSNTLASMTVVGANDIWTVGNYDDGTPQALTEHWDGAVWRIVPSAKLSTAYNYLNGVAAVAANDVWAVGSAGDRTLAEHWNGSSWSIVPSANVGIGANYLTGLAVVGPNDIWAVGYYINASTLLLQTLAEHWNGSSWAVIASPNVGTYHNFLYAVAAVGPNDVWTVGSHPGQGNPQTLTEHWNGASWAVVASPNISANSNVLASVAAASAHDVWAVGTYYTYNYPKPNRNATLTEHWNGSQWLVVPSPNAGPGNNYLAAVAVVGTNDVWAAGYDLDAGNRRQPLLEHWNGSQWAVVPSPSLPTGDGALKGLAVVDAHDVWAAGDTNPTGVLQTLILHFAEPCAPIRPSVAAGLGAAGSEPRPLPPHPRVALTGTACYNTTGGRAERPREVTRI